MGPNPRSLSDEELAELMDPASWDWEDPIDVEIAKELRIIASVEFTRAEFQALTDDARRVGLGPLAYLRQVATRADRQDVRRPPGDGEEPGDV